MRASGHRYAEPMHDRSVSRRRAIMVAFALGVILCAPGALSAPAHAEPVKRVSVRDYFSQQDVERSKRYRAGAYGLSFIGLGVEIVVLAALGLARGTRLLGRVSRVIAGDHWALQAIVIAVLVSIAVALAAMPFTISGYYLDRAWGLSTQTFGSFLTDAGRALAFQTVIAVTAGLLFVGVARRLPRGWPAVVAAGAIVLTFVLSMLWPLVYEPLFNRFSPVDRALRDRIVEIGRKEGVKVGSVVVADASRRTTAKNAYVSGLGATKRVVLYDTLLRGASPRELDVVVAHELGHVAHNDVLKGTALGAAGAAGAVLFLWGVFAIPAVRRYLGISGAADPRVLPFAAFALVVVSTLSLPIGNWYSRGIEARADQAAIATTNDPVADIVVEVKLARSNLSDLEPNDFVRWAFYTHPPTLDRIRLALDYAAAHGTLDQTVRDARAAAASAEGLGGSL